MLAFLFVVELATLSRSGLLGLAVGLLVLAVPYRRRLVSRDLLVPLAAALGLVAIVVLSRLDFFETVIRSRFQTRRQLDVGALRRLRLHPERAAPDTRCSGSGSTTFSVYYETVTGKTNWGPHSFYVALLVETGLVGDGRVRRLPLVPVPPAGRRARDRDGRWRRSATRPPRGCGRSPGG